MWKPRIYFKQAKISSLHLSCGNLLPLGKKKAPKLGKKNPCCFSCRWGNRHYRIFPCILLVAGWSKIFPYVFYHLITKVLGWPKVHSGFHNILQKNPTQYFSLRNKHTFLKVKNLKKCEFIFLLELYCQYCPLSSIWKQNIYCVLSRPWR